MKDLSLKDHCMAFLEALLFTIAALLFSLVLTAYIMDAPFACIGPWLFQQLP